MKRPARRYAIFTNLFCQDYMIVVRGDDMKTAEKWGGFVCWVGGVRPADNGLPIDNRV